MWNRVRLGGWVAVFGFLLASSPLLAAEDLASKRVEAEKRQLRELGPTLSMAFSTGGTVKNDIAAAADMAKKASIVRLSTPELRSARLKFFDVATLYKAGMSVWSGQFFKAPQLRDYKKAFMAGLLDDEDAKAEVLTDVLLRVADIEAHRAAGDEIVGMGVKTHGEIWTKDLLPLVKRVAGPKANFPLFQVAVARGGRGKTGIVFKNISGGALSNVTLAISSQIGDADTGKTPHFVFLADLGAGQEIMMPWRLSAGVTDLGANANVGEGIAFSAWSNEWTLEKQEFKLPAGWEAQRRARAAATGQPAPFRLTLIQVGGPTGKPPGIGIK